MEAMGARSNPAPTGLLPRLAALHARLQAENQGYPTPHPVRRKPQPLLKTILRILQEADGPLHVREIHARAETLLGEPVSWTSLKAASASTAAATTPASAGYSAAGTGGRSITGAGEGVTGGLKLAGIRRSSLVAAQDRRPLTSVHAGTTLVAEKPSRTEAMMGVLARAIFLVMGVALLALAPQAVAVPAGSDLLATDPEETRGRSRSSGSP